MRRGERDPIVLVPKLTVELADFQYQDEKLQVGRFELAGSASVKDPSARGGGRFQVSTLRASIADVTWPVVRPGRVDVRSSVPGGGLLNLTGQLSPPPAASQLRLQLERVDLGKWASLVPSSLRVEGLVEANLQIDEPLVPAVPSHVQGAIAVNQLGVKDARRELLRARRVEAKGIEVDWPSRLAARQLVITGPRGTIERDSTGGIALPSGLPGQAAPGAAGAPPAAPAAPLGAGRRRDRREGRRPRVARSRRQAGRRPRIRGPRGQGHRGGLAPPWPAGRPGRGAPAGRRPGRVRRPGGRRSDHRRRAGDRQRCGSRALSGLCSLAGEDRRPRRTSTSPWRCRPWRRDGPSCGAAPRRSLIDVRDGERTVMRVERAQATGVDIDWPRRVAVRDVTLQRPWVLLERDQGGALTLRVLLSPRAPDGAGPRGSTPSASAPIRPLPASSGGSTIPITVDHLVVADGGARTVDHRVAPPIALDTQRLTGRIDGLSTDPRAKPARLDMTGRVGADSDLALRGTVGSLGGPLRLDMNAELRGFAVPRTNPYLVQQVAWEARGGRLTTSVSCRIDGDVLDAKTDILLSQLEVARAGGGDGAQARIGLPLGMIVALMKDRRGDIRLSLPVGGRLSDPRFDMSEALWSTVRNVAVKAITAPVSWIGRVQVGSDSRIQRVEIDPIPFAPGSATLAAEAQEQVARLAAFLEQVPVVRLSLMPAVSSRDRAALEEKARTSRRTARLSRRRRRSDGVGDKGHRRRTSLTSRPGASKRCAKGSRRPASTAGG